MKAGDLIYPWPNEELVGLVVGVTSDEWEDRFLVLFEGEVFEVPCHQVELIDESRRSSKT